MLDFLEIAARRKRAGSLEVDIIPKFMARRTEDLMIRGRAFYRIWNQDEGLWSTKQSVATALIDKELYLWSEDYKKKHPDDRINVCYLKDTDNGSIDKWRKFCEKQMWDTYHALDEKLIFSNMPARKEDYASKRLTYPLEIGPTPAYDELMSVLYSPEERHKIEWAIGCIVAGESIKTQKFLVFYGSAGTGKSTVLNIIQALFDGYYSVFDAKALGSSNRFALEAFRTNPLVAIQHDGDLSHIEDNTRLNSIVSHEEMTVEHKNKSLYSDTFNSFLFMGTNRPVKITDSRSGILRRLIDVSPTGNKLSPKDYRRVVKQVLFELGGIASHCRDIYLSDPEYYSDYVPISMMGRSNDFYNYILECYDTFTRQKDVTLKQAWELYKNYIEDAKVPYPYSQRIFKEELKSYFDDFQERTYGEDGSRVRNLYVGFKTDKFVNDKVEIVPSSKSWLIFNSIESLLDQELKDCPAQLASDAETPKYSWDNVTTKLMDIPTDKLHYVRVPETHIVIDFDIPDENGNKSYEKNLEAASMWPRTYAELSKSGKGIHLHYIYTGGDPSKLKRIFSDHIEIKVFTGKSSLRRKLSLCNDIPIRVINSGLPLKGEDKVVTTKTISSEKALRNLIIRNLNKEIHPATKPSIDFIYDILEEQYASGLRYDIRDMRQDILTFALLSTNNSEYCVAKANKMKYRSAEPEGESTTEDLTNPNKEAPIVFYDIEVFPNLLVINWKRRGGKNIVRMINPTPQEVETLLKFRLVGFNNRKYDNHIIYARLLGYSNYELFNLSKEIIGGVSTNCFFSEAYNLSYTDIYDFAAKKQSLKKWEIELGIHHQELGLPWDQPVPEELWPKVAEYCDNDVMATEAVFEHLQGDFTARLILAELTGMTPNDTTNTLTGRLIFGSDRTPQGQFVYRDLSKPVKQLDPDVEEFLWKTKPKMMEYWSHTDSKLPYFPGYSFDPYRKDKSLYKGVAVGEGGLVYAVPGMYYTLTTEDVESEHPNSLISECAFGPKYTKRFNDLVQVRLCVKHKDYDKAKELFDGKLSGYLNDQSQAKALSQALKIAINSVYGLTSAHFSNLFRDPRNVDNLVAKRGRLFMVDLKEYVENVLGAEVVHIKTDSIKVSNCTPEIENAISEFGERYGYKFEVEHKFEKLCLVNNAVYIAKLAEDDPDSPGKWTATGTQFAVPYVFKTLFSKEPLIFSDFCETKEVKTSMYLDFNESLPEGEHDYRYIGKVGNFCPMMPGAGGGYLVRANKDNTKYDSVTGTKGYRWMEAEQVMLLDKHDSIDMTYYRRLADDAIATIEEYGDSERFRE